MKLTFIGKNIKVVCATILLLCTPVWANHQDECGRLLYIPGSFEKSTNLNYSKTADIHKIYRMLGDVSIGNIFYIKESESHIRLYWMEVVEEYRNIGVSRLLFSEMIKDNPDVKEISSDLVFENLSAADKTKETECVKAVVNTPAYKVRQSLGFSRIITCDYVVGGFIHLVVGRD